MPYSSHETPTFLAEATPHGRMNRAVKANRPKKSDHLRRIVHLVQFLSLRLFLSRRCQNHGVSADLQDEVNNRGLIRPIRHPKTNLLNQIKEVPLRVRSVCRCSLIGLVKCRDRSMEDADRTFAELQVFVRRARIILYTKTPMSKCAGRFDTDAFTYRGQEDQCLLQISEILDFFLANAGGNVLDERMEFF